MQNNIVTRSRTKLTKPILEVDIDFTIASNEWHKNKRSIGNGHYKYICTITTNKNPDIKTQCNKVCNKVCYKDNDKCWIHRNK